MVEQAAPFKLLTTFSGMVYRQPLFVTDKLEVNSYHIRFLDKQGEQLDDDAPVPEFLKQLPYILPELGGRQDTLLSVPESWRQALYQNNESHPSLILDLNGGSYPTETKHLFSFARDTDNIQGDDQVNTLLIDMQKLSIDDITGHLSVWRQNHQVLCATNVNGHEQYQFCKRHGLDLLEGQFYTLPVADNNQGIPLSAKVLMTLLIKLQDPDVDAEDLAMTINKDLSLSYKLLRLINSAFFGLPREVGSIKQAIVMLGHKKIKTWASLLSLSAIDNKPNELRILSMTRAKMCELLSNYYKGTPENYFAAGLFSTLDALLDKPLADILPQLPLSAELNDALLHHSGPIGQALSDVLNYEKGDWQALSHSKLPIEVISSSYFGDLLNDEDGDWQALNVSPLPIEVIARSYLNAINWAKELNSQLTD